MYLRCTTCLASTAGGLSRLLSDVEQLTHDDLGHLRDATSQSQLQPIPHSTGSATHPQPQSSTPSIDPSSHTSATGLSIYIYVF